MVDKQNRGLKFLYFVLGIALPVAACTLWVRTDGYCKGKKKSRVDKAHDVTVEDSFPASDPPSAW
jgi:hypothetical protein